MAGYIRGLMDRGLNKVESKTMTEGHGSMGSMSRVGLAAEIDTEKSCHEED